MNPNYFTEDDWKSELGVEMTTHKEQLLNSYANFNQTVDQIDWKRFAYYGYEEVTVFLVSLSLFNELENVNKRQGTCDYECEILNVMSKPEHKDQFILLYVYNNNVSINGVNLKPLID